MVAQQNTTSQTQSQSTIGYSPLLAQTILAQNKQIIAPKAVVNVELTEAQKRVSGYKNNLKDMLTHNQANIIAVIPPYFHTCIITQHTFSVNICMFVITKFTHFLLFGKNHLHYFSKHAIIIQI